MGLALIALVMMTGTLSLKEIVGQQDQGLAFVVYQPLGFIIFIICAFAETNRAPFDLPECESELVGGYHTEYSSMKLGFFLFAEYINMFISSAIMASLYFGGYNFPFQHELGLDGNVLTIVPGDRFLWKNLHLHFCIHVGSLDTSSIPLRPIDEFGLESLVAVGHCQHHHHRFCNVVYG